MVLMHDQRKSNLLDRLVPGMNNFLFMNKVLNDRFEALRPSLADFGKSFALLALVGLIGCLDRPRTPDAPPAEGVYTIQAALEGSRGALAQAKVTVVPEPEKEISAPATVPPDAEGQTATIRPTPHGSYYWAIKGGRITQGKRQDKVTFQAGHGNALLLTCTATNPAGDSIRSSRKIRIAPPDSIGIRP